MSEIKFFDVSPAANAEELSKTSRSGDVRWFKTRQDGTYKFRVCPPWSVVGKIGMKVFKCWNIPYKGQETSFIEIEQTFPGKGYVNPIMEVIRKYKKLGVNTENWEADAYGYMNIQILQAPSGVDFDSKVPYLWESPPFGMDWVLKKNQDPDFANFVHPVNGFPIRIDRINKSGNISYERSLLPQQRGPMFADQGELQKFLENLYKIDEIFSEPDQAYMDALKEAAGNLENLFETKLRDIGGGATKIAQGNQSMFSQAPEKKFWVFLNGQTTLVTSMELQGAVMRYGDDMQIMSEDQTSGWKTARDFGFGTSVSSPPPPSVASVAPTIPAAPVVPTTPAVPVVPTIPAVPVAPTIPAAPVVPTIPAAPVAPATTSVQVIDRPKGSPECFSNKEVFSDTALTCLACVFQMDCSNAIKAKG